MQIDNALLVQLLAVTNIGAIVLYLVQRTATRKERQGEIETKLRAELSTHVDRLNTELQETRNMITQLWDARDEDRAYIAALECYVDDLTRIMREAKLSPPRRPSRRFREKKET